MHFPTGDKGQRYEVRAKESDGNAFVVGWTEKADGGALVKCIDLHPVFHSPRLVDRQEPNHANGP